MLTNHTFRTRVLAFALVAALFGVPLPARHSFIATLDAQATLNTTTIAAALTKASTVVVLTSGSTVVAGQFGYVDRELIRFQSAQGTSTTIWNIIRGTNGTITDDHAALTLILTGPGNYFAGSPNGPQAGICDATKEIALPVIDVRSGDMYDCRGLSATTQVWVRYRTAGRLDPTLGLLTGPADVAPAYTASGALAIVPGVSFLSCAGVCAMTLANPTVIQNGMIMIIQSTTAQAHTVTYTAGFSGGTTARDVATYGAAIPNTLIIMAVNGVWYQLAVFGVTLG